jgi:hypothetical protein
VTFNGMVGFAADHPDRRRIDQVDDGEIDYDLAFVKEEDGSVAVEDQDYRVVDRPRGAVHKLTRKLD